MRTPARAVLALTVTVFLAACGENADDPEPDARASSTEQITADGIAGIVEDHLGADRVRMFGTYGDEPGSVGLMVSLRDGGRRDMFAVSVYSPDHAEGEFGAGAAKCPRSGRADKYTRQRTCTVLEDGRIVIGYLVPSGFSDDNADGRVVAGSAGSQDVGAVMAMYESYDAEAPVTVREIVELLSDPRLAWMTDPAVNDAGADIVVKKLRG